MLISTCPPPTSCKAAEDLHEGPASLPPRARLLRTCTRVRLLPFGNGGISAALSDGSYVGRGVRLPVRSHHHASDK